METSGHDPAKLLRWIIKETGAVPNYANNPQAENKNNNDNNDSKNENDTIPITRLSDLDEQERTKWTNIILGQTPDILNNRNSLKQAIEELNSIKLSNKSFIPALKNNEQNKQIKLCLDIIHNLLDKNEAVLVKLNCIQLLLELIPESITINNEICLDSCTILHDATQNNPMMQNHIYSQQGIKIILNTLSNCDIHNYKIRAKLWALIHVISREHNPNFNVFLSNNGHLEINRVLRIEQSNITEYLLKEILRVSRLINYMFGIWSDGNDKVFKILSIFGSINWTIYSLHCYIIKLVSSEYIDNNNRRLIICQLVLDILIELIGGIRLFMKRNDKCQKFVIKNKNNRDIVSKLEQLQIDLGEYCNKHKPNLKLEEKTKNGKPYKYKYYKILNDGKCDELKENDNDNDNDNNNDIYLAMKDIWNIINSILRDRDELRKEMKERKEMEKKSSIKNNQISNDININNDNDNDNDQNVINNNDKQYKIQVCDVSRDLLSKK